MFRNLGLIIKRDFLATLRRPFYLIFAIGAPLILAIVAAVIYQVNSQPGDQAPGEATPGETEVEAIAFGIVDEAGILPDLSTAEIPDLVVFLDTADAREATESGEITGYYVIPDDFLETGIIDFYIASANPLSINTNAYLLQRLLVVGMLKDDPALSIQVLDPFVVKTVALEAPEESQVTADNWFASNLSMFMVILLYMVILIPASNLVSSLTDEKKNLVMEVLLCSVSPMQLFVGKLLATGLLGLLQTVMWVGVLWGVGTLGGRPLGLPEGYNVPTDLLAWGIVFAILGYLMFGAQLGGVGAIAPNLNETRSVTMLILSPLIIGYTLSVAITEAPDSILSYFLSYFPLTAPVAMVGRMAAGHLPFWEPLLSAVLQLLAVVLLVRLFGRLFHARLMLSGQPLTVRRLFKALSEK